MNKEAIIAKAKELSEAEFSYSYSNDFEPLAALDHGCSGIVMEAFVLYFEIKNLASLLKTGKRATAKVYKIYCHALDEAAKGTGGHLSCLTPESFLIIYPKDSHDANQAVDAALKTADLIAKTLGEATETLAHPNFAIGVDVGNILGTKALSDNGNERIIWLGSSIDKAKAISHECNRPFFVGLSGTVFHHLDEDHRTTTKRIMGFKKQIDIWSTVTYQFENTKKHLHQTNLLKSFEDD